MRVMMQYISDEAPLPHDLKKLARGWGLQLKDVETVCNDPDLCLNTKEGFTPILGSEFLEASLNQMKGNSKGGKQAAITRAKNRIAEQEAMASDLQVTSNSIPSDLQVTTSSVHSPLVPSTKNQAPSTQHQELSTNLSTNVDSKGAVQEKKQGVFRPNDVDLEVWEEWLAYRKKIKASVSPTVIKGLCKEGDKAKMSLQEVLEACLTNGWRGFQAEWVLKNRPREPLGSNGLPLSHASNINEKHRDEKAGDFTQDDWDKLMKTGKYAQQ
jgi:hypothetical protein